jgi:fatty acid desaturase
VGLLPLHDASHCAITKSPWVWRVLGASHDFLNGASYVNWCYQHMLGHHPYTNIADADPDISTNEPDVRRIKASQKWHQRYVNQHLFVPLLYGVLAMKVRIMDVMSLFVTKLNGEIRVNPVTGWHFWAFWLGKVPFGGHCIVASYLLTTTKNFF